MDKEKVLNLLGLAQRARMTVLGESMIIEQMKHTTKGIVFLASDAGDNIVKKIKNKSNTYDHVLITGFDGETLSKAIGKENRKVVFITDKGFIKKFTEYINS
jgi:ribosomal protein L7Ae-like RNA K-turn-binding protein